jgi:zinc-ribbon domain
LQWQEPIRNPHFAIRILIMPPEISRRCSSCGASIREPDALFCPECGEVLTKTPEAAKPETPTVSLSDSLVDGRLGRYKETVEKSGAALSSPASAPPAKDVKPPVTPSAASSDTKAVTGEAAQPIVYAGVKHEKTRERLHRASSMARGVIEDEVKRVERIRHVSSAMIEGATYDPSLRFVLVALGIFIVFVILLVLSKVMG